MGLFPQHAQAHLPRLARAGLLSNIFKDKYSFLVSLLLPLRGCINWQHLIQLIWFPNAFSIFSGKFVWRCKNDSIFHSQLNFTCCPTVIKFLGLRNAQTSIGKISENTFKERQKQIIYNNYFSISYKGQKKKSRNHCL